MKREARLLLDKAVDSLILSVEQFNRADERGRATTVLILLDHSFEMLCAPVAPYFSPLACKLPPS